MALSIWSSCIFRCRRRLSHCLSPGCCNSGPETQITSPAPIYTYTIGQNGWQTFIGTLYRGSSKSFNNYYKRLGCQAVVRAVESMALASGAVASFGVGVVYPIAYHLDAVTGVPKPKSHHRRLFIHTPLAKMVGKHIHNRYFLIFFLTLRMKLHLSGIFKVM